MLLTTLSVTGCNSWPEPAERVLSVSETQQQSFEAVSPDYIKNLLGISYARTEIMVNKGAGYCLPGQIEKVHQYLERSKQEVDGNLLLDAQYHIALAMEQLEYIVQMMYSLDINSDCLSDFAKNKSKKDSVPHFTEELSDLLNCDCRQISETGSISREFMKRLKMAARTLNKHHDLNLNVYAINADSKKMIADFFKDESVSKSRVVFNESIHSISDNGLLSQDGLYFSFSLNQQQKVLSIRKWRDSINIKSSINRRVDGYVP